MTRKDILTNSLGLAIVAGLIVGLLPASAQAQQYDSGGKAELDPAGIDKYVTPMVIPPAMPRTDVIPQQGMGKKTDYYEIAVRQFDQQILPAGQPATTVWSYGSVQAPGTVAEGGSFNYPAFTVEARWEQPVRVKWINELVKDPIDCYYTLGGPFNADSCNYLSHLLPVDQTLHWANPPMDCIEGEPRTDCRGFSQAAYDGPVPAVIHLHGAETTEDSDGYPEAWWLPAANDIPGGYATGGSFYDTFKNSSLYTADWTPGAAVFEYPNEQEATTLWYHDHSLGITRLNVYAGPAGFYLLRGGPSDMVLDSKGKPATLPGPAPQLGDAPGMSYYEIPIVIQDRSFFEDGSLAYPDNRAFFEEVNPYAVVPYLNIPFIPDVAIGGGTSDVSPIWNPEFFGNTIVVNGNTWPYLDVEQRRYRLRLLNGSQSRFLILQFDDANVDVWQIGASQGFLPAPLYLNDESTNGIGGGILLGPAERADLIVDFSNVPRGTSITMLNFGPDEPFGGGEEGEGFESADPATTGQVMQFRVVRRQGADKSTPPAELLLPAPPVLPAADNTRTISLNELESETVCAIEDDDGNIVEADCTTGAPFGPTEARLGVLDENDENGIAKGWAEEITEHVAAAGDVEVWEIYNFTADAHPIHIHLIQFQVVDRQLLAVDEEGVALQPADLCEPNPMDPMDSCVRGPEPWETGYKDTVIAYPGEVTRVKAQYPLAGLFVWHCHILEHEDNEMMRPYCVGESAACDQHNASAMAMP